MVTVAKLWAENEETREGSIASVNKSGEEIGGLFVDGERMSLEDYLHGAIEDREDDVDHGDAGSGDPLPLQKQSFRWRLSNSKVTLPLVAKCSADSGCTAGHGKGHQGNEREARTKSFTLGRGSREIACLKCITNN